MRLASLEGQVARLRTEQARFAQQLSATRRTLAVSQHELGDRLATLYKQGDISALAVVLGSESLDDAVTRLDDLNRVADQSRQVVAVTADAQSRLDRLRATLQARRAMMSTAVVDAQQSVASLESARVDRIGFISRLRQEQKLRAAQIHALETAAQRVEHRSAALQAAALAGEATSAAAASSSGRSAAPAPVSGRAVTVSSTGYALAGRTATGMPVGWGVVAVDPSVIPLGTRLTIPGYGEGVAADTGGTVRGNTIDLWFPTLAEARAWGRRTVTITLH